MGRFLWHSLKGKHCLFFVGCYLERKHQTGHTVSVCTLSRHRKGKLKLEKDCTAFHRQPKTHTSRAWYLTRYILKSEFRFTFVLRFSQTHLKWAALYLYNLLFQGLEYIHKSEVNFHGNMKSSNCVIDSRWTCKLTDFGVPSLKAKERASMDTIDDISSRE